MSITKQRGRPRNASRLNVTDYATLERVADCLVREPELRYPTTAMRRIGIDHPNDHKRLLSKWWPVEDRYLREARQRRTAAQFAAMERGLRQLGDFVLRVAVAADRAAAEAIKRYVRWADENPREAANLKAALLNVRTLQIDAKTQRT